MSARWFSLAALVSLCVSVAGLLAGVPAQAAVTHDYLSRISEVPAKGPHGETISLPGPLGEATGMAVDGGELYVADGYEPSRLDKFDAETGAFISQLPQVPAPVYDLRQSVAVGHATGETEVYVTGDEHAAEGTTGLVAVYGPAGKLQGLWNGADTPSKAFGCFECGPRGTVAVDDSANLLTHGDVYVSDPQNNVVDVFKALAGGGEQYVTQLTGPELKVPFAGVRGIAVNQLDGDLLVADGGTTVDVFEPQTLNEYALVRQLTGTPSGPFKEVSGVTADGGNGDIYITESERGVVDQFGPAGAYLGYLTGSGTPAGAFGELAGVAVDSGTHDVYVGDHERLGSFVDVFGPGIVVPDVATEPASSVKARSATLNGTVNPDEVGAATCRFEWGLSASLGEVAPCEPEGVANGNSSVAVHAALSGLQPDTTYHYRLQASNTNGRNPGESVQTREFTTPGPGVQEESASSVTVSSVTLHATIDPDNAPTNYYFQYGTSTSYGSVLPAPPGLAVGSAKGQVPVSVHPQGLVAATTYHYRVVAVSELGGESVTVEGPDQTFATQSADAQVTQPDGRQWELVSPPNKQGAGIIAIGNEQGDDIQAALDGSGITYGATAPFVLNPAGSRAIEVTQVISHRRTPGSWETADISTAHNGGSLEAQLGHAAEYKLFSSDLSAGLVEPAGDSPLPPLSPTAEKTIYLREPGGGYMALVTAANVSTGVSFGHFGGAGFVSATADLSHVAISSDVALTSDAPPTGGLYEWNGGRLEFISVLPDGEATSHANLGYEGEASRGDVRHAISEDGSRLVWTSGGGLYLRDTSRGETIRLDAARGTAEPESARSVFRTANNTDSRVFFTSPERLTATATASPDEAAEDLYEFDLTSGPEQPLSGTLTDLSVDRNVDESAAVKGVIGAGEDGSHVYFAAGGVLGDGAERGAVRGAANLYLDRYDTVSGTWSAPEFITTLAADDSASWGSGATNLTQMTARVSPNGRYLAFMSERALTGYDNSDANSGIPDEEVFLYDAETGRTICPSCNPTGARPVGSTGSGRYEERLWDYAGLWTGRWVAGDIPGWTNRDISSALYQSRYLGDGGRLFFNSSDALVPADVNGTEDVYEYEPAGVGSCQGSTHGQSASVVFSTALDGCVALISAGTSSEESAFMDASETGGDVFFLTLSRLSLQDDDTSIDLYDAHECSAVSPCAPPASLTPPPCTTGDACKPAPTPQPPLFGAPSSETFSGAGNVIPSAPSTHVVVRSLTRAQKLAGALRACKSRRRRAACERQARQRYGKPKARRAERAHHHTTSKVNATGERRRAR